MKLALLNFNHKLNVYFFFVSDFTSGLGLSVTLKTAVFLTGLDFVNFAGFVSFFGASCFGVWATIAVENNPTQAKINVNFFILKYFNLVG